MISKQTHTQKKTKRDFTCLNAFLFLVSSFPLTHHDTGILHKQIALNLNSLNGKSCPLSPLRHSILLSKYRSCTTSQHLFAYQTNLHRCCAIMQRSRDWKSQIRSYSKAINCLLQGKKKKSLKASTVNLLDEKRKKGLRFLLVSFLLQ